MHTIKYRTTEERLRPRRIKLQIPGWGVNQSPVPMTLTNMRGIAFLSRRLRDMALKCSTRTRMSCAREH